eukprot:TRINITY_DN4527_c0_g1_i1.p1 TRINITY_DN4527_c0_g1~~TRINITY_DN4527_c0_g1_i1.p1  ORF type:complete len:853 (+),score=231.37 TRINITY_DN4527_c0_g1_i1:68-2626(+)
MASKNDQILPSKEAALFKDTVRLYEQKSYKKALKNADSILKKYPTNGETLSMKGLILKYMDQKEEALQLAKDGIKYNMKSHVCWHVLGLIYRADHDYAEAKKCYQLALKRDENNLTIIRDLALLQVHLRDYAGYADSRRRLAIIHPAKRNSWVALALAYHMANNFKSAIDILNKGETAIEPPKKEPKTPTEVLLEYSENLLYKNMVLFESGDHQAALTHIDSIMADILDKTAGKEQKVKILLALGQYESAEEVATSLLTQNPDNYGYHASLQKCKAAGESLDGELSEALYAKLVTLYTNLKKKFPKSEACKLIPLSFYKGQDFEREIDSFLLHSLKKGIPSLFRNLKKICKDDEKSKVIERLAQSYLKSLTETNKFPSSESEESPACLLYTYFFLAQFYDHKRDLAQALSMIDLAIDHTPTLPDLYLFKGRISKHAGDLQKAQECANTARELDLADRNLNTKCTKYILRNDQTEFADSIVNLFTKDGDTGNNLYDMQCMWYESEIGQSYLRLKKYGPALKKFVAIKKHIDDMVEDQFDFHTYCLRKMTVRSYVAMLRFEDRIYGHPFFFNGARGMIQIYTILHDNPSIKEVQTQVEDPTAGMDEQAKKKYLAKLKKEQARQKQKEEETKKQEASQGKGQKVAEKKKTDPDPQGMELLKVQDPLAEALKIVNILQLHAAKRLETHQLAFEVHIRRGKYLLALRSIVQSLKIAPQDGTTLINVVRFVKAVQSSRQLIPEVVLEAITEELKSHNIDLENVASLQARVDAFISSNQSSYESTVYGVKALLELNPENKAPLEILLSVDGKAISAEAGKSALELAEANGNAQLAAALKQKLHTALPLCPSFQPAADSQ